MWIDQETFLLFKRVIEKEDWIEIPSSGYSMFPFIQSGNTCRFSTCDPRTVKKGDIILFYSSQGQLVAHRFYKTERMDGKPFYFFKGDTNLGFDEPIETTRILGRLVMVIKKNKKVFPDDRISNLWGKIILSFPMTSSILRKYLVRRKYLHE